ncbi:TonB-dependent receptor [Alcaligenaceae bacterium SAGV5]|nr:TonB-dependent receptor [Alcaligenaceae bacterium SAGV5]
MADDRRQAGQRRNVDGLPVRASPLPPQADRTRPGPRCRRKRYADAARGWRLPQGKRTYTDRPYNESQGVTVRSFALEYAVSPSDGLTLTAGVGRHLQRINSATTLGATSYLIGASQELDARTRLRASLSRQARMPSLRQLYDPTRGNPGLRAESALNAELGIEHQLDERTRLSATLFQNRVSNYIENSAATDRFENFSRYRFRGLELATTVHAGRTLLINGSYTYLQARNMDGSGVDDLQYRPRHTIGAAAAWRFAPDMTLSGTVEYVSNLPYYSRDTPPSKARLGSFVLLGVRVARQLPGTDMTLYAGASNLLDKNYQTSYGLPQPGRTIYIGMAYRL